jgi:hypothetical protein
MKAAHIITGFSILAISSGIFFWATKNSTGQTGAQSLKINPPLPGADIAFDQYQVHPDSSLIIERANGTMLNIPADCFVKKDGSKPSSGVQIQVREFHDPYTILTAGIPMEIAGSNGEHLQSAGMIEMHAFEGKEELKIREGKNIDISLASFRNSDQYNLYYLDNDQQWMTRGNFTNEPNLRKKNQLAELSKTPPPPSADSIGDFVFVISGDTSINPELKPFIGQEWLLIEKEKERGARTAMRQSWSKVKIERINKRKMTYRIIFEYDESGNEDIGKSSFSIMASPIMDKDQSRRRNRKDFEEQLKEYELLVQQNEAEKERIKIQADMVNSFKADKMGIWNIDAVMKEEIMITHMHFDFEKEMYGSSKEHYVYMIYEENNSVVYIQRNEWAKFPVPKNKPVTLVAVLSDGNVALVKNDEIKTKLKPASSDMHVSSVRQPLSAWLSERKIPGVAMK